MNAANNQPAGKLRPAHNQSLGSDGEQLVADYLRRNGYRIVAQNWRFGHGEIDLLAQRSKLLVAVEVKTRRGARYGNPLEAVTPAKVRQVRKLLGHYMETVQPAGIVAVRIDAAGVIVDADGSYTIDYLQGVGNE